MSLMINYKNVLSSEEALSSLKSFLLNYYFSEYGEDSQDKILKNFQNTVFITSSFPNEKRDFFQKYGSFLPRNAYFSMLHEFFDYQWWNQRLENELLEEFCSSVYGDSVPPQKEFLTLDYESFGIDAYSTMFHGSKEEKEKIVTRQNQYLLECMELGIDPVRNVQKVEEIISLRKRLRKEKNRELLQSTIWGKNVKKDIQKQGFSFSDETLSSILFDRSVAASTSLVLDQEEKERIVCFVPFFFGKNVEGLDRIFLHEFRHIAEMHEKGTGFESFEKTHYGLFNEIRTDYNACLDMNHFSTSLWFSRGGERRSFYAQFFPQFHEFLYQNRELCNYLSLKGDVSLEEVFGEDMMQKFVDILSSENTKGKELVYKN